MRGCTTITPCCRTRLNVLFKSHRCHFLHPLTLNECRQPHLQANLVDWQLLIRRQLTSHLFKPPQRAPNPRNDQKGGEMRFRGWEPKKGKLLRKRLNAHPNRRLLLQLKKVRPHPLLQLKRFSIGSCGSR